MEAVREFAEDASTRPSFRTRSRQSPPVPGKKEPFSRTLARGDGEKSGLMKVMDEAPNAPLVRLIVTEHGIPSQARASWGQSHHSSRRSNDLSGGLGKPAVGRRVTGEPLEPDAATRHAERPKGEKRKRARRLLGSLYGRF